MADAELTEVIRKASKKKMFFALVLKGVEGKFLASKHKVPPKEIANAKEEIGGGATVVIGTFTGPLNKMVFLVDKVPPAPVVPTLKKVVKRDTGLSIVAEFKVADLEEEDDGEEGEGDE